MRGAQTWKTNRARVLCANETAPEEILCAELRGRRFRGLKFVRRMPLGAYFADFACRSERIVVEVDGGTHSTAAEFESDRRRTRHLEERGYRIFRASNVEIYENIDGVLDSLLEFIEGSND